MEPHDRRTRLMQRDMSTRECGSARARISCGAQRARHRRRIVMGRFTRGFMSGARGERDPRLPPGQYDTGSSWPVLTAEVAPRLDTATWTFKIEGLVDRPTTWTW